ncbi:protease inhibitor I42 family protein [Kitasatospora aureofaciens]|uniref:protease inhibitor I42 family protein n=1 Tax=Kitasatospora aureofaciens TaxID=1894 RepID=UPI0004BE8CFA|nr:protease inhibitor I42 family protein [Streptomyces viridifaciens]
MNLRRPAALALTCAAALLALTGCGSKGAATAASAPAPTTTALSTPAAVTADEHANHTTLKVAAGATVSIQLHGTYWSAVSSSAGDVLASVGAPTTAPSPSCRPGGGCGTVTTSFTARTAGTAHLTASRTACGEALNCAPDQRSYDVTVEVTG